MRRVLQAAAGILALTAVAGVLLLARQAPGADRAFR